MPKMRKLKALPGKSKNPNISMRKFGEKARFHGDIPMKPRRVIASNRARKGIGDFIGTKKGPNLETIFLYEAPSNQQPQKNKKDKP